MKRKLLLFLGITLLASCQKTKVVDEVVDVYEEWNEVEKAVVDYSSAQLFWHSDVFDTYETDLWTMSFFTADKSEAMQIVFNIKQSANGKMDPSLVCGELHAPSSYSDVSHLTLVNTYVDSFDSPYGEINYPTGCLCYNEKLKDSPTGGYIFILDGRINISLNENSEYVVKGYLLDDSFCKHHIDYTGPIEAFEESYYPEFPNSNLTQNLKLPKFTQARIQDLGDRFMLGDNSYRMYSLILAEDGVDLSSYYPKGTGAYLKIECFVLPNATVSKGLPEGTYQMGTALNGGLTRESIAPFKLYPGKENNFSKTSGCWYVRLEKDEWVDYARINGGSLSVESNTYSFNLKDCSENAIEGSWTGSNYIVL